MEGAVVMSRWLAVMCPAVLTAIVGLAAGQGGTAAPPSIKPSSGWTLPPDAKEKQNPLTVDEKILAAGKTVFKDKCQKCHGPAGLGDGPDADPDSQEDMDLTNP
jgi:mono/diheme cytochrome c family protein